MLSRQRATTTDGEEGEEGTKEGQQGMPIFGGGKDRGSEQGSEQGGEEGCSDRVDDGRGFPRLPPALERHLQEQF